MVDEIRIYNTSLQHTIFFDRDNADYLIDDDGIDWGDVLSTLSTINNLDGYGATLNAVITAESRIVTITGWVVGTEAEMAEKKAILTRVLAPQDTIQIHVPIEPESAYHYDLNTKLSASVKFDQSYKANNEKMCKFTFSLAAAYPFFEYSKGYNITESPYNILNMGSIPAGVELTWVFDSAVSNPMIQIRMTDGRYSIFQLNDSYDAGTSVYLNTKYASKQLLINGERKFSAMNPSFGWLHIPVSYSEENYAAITIPSGTRLTSFEYSESYTSLEML